MNSLTFLKQLAVIGHPVEHSLSPLMHTAALKKLKLPYVYKKIHVLPEKLEKFCQETKQGKNKLVGFNITLPHKEKIIAYLDWISPLAKLTRAVNTVVNHQGQLLGFNTDGLGYVESLTQEIPIQLKGAKVTLLGAGGAAHAVATALAKSETTHITIANRTLVRAKKLVKSLATHFPKIHFEAMDLSDSRFFKALTKSKLIINTTSAGLANPSATQIFSDFPWKKLKPNTIISDLVYTPLITPFLKAAKQQGLPIHPGLGMLIHQGALSFQLWTGQYPDIKLMRKVVELKLKIRRN